jgi:hypothetical protein
MTAGFGKDAGGNKAPRARRTKARKEKNAVVEAVVVVVVVVCVLQTSVHLVRG